MSKYIDEVIHLIEKQSLKVGDITIIRLEGFENPIIYKEICKHFKASSKVNLNAKLSKEKYEDFKSANNPNWDIAISFLEDNDYIDTEGAMTKWRNNSTEIESVNDVKNLVMLMGTELVEDKGGLADFYKITPESILEALKGNYAGWFTEIIEEAQLDKDIKKGINTFFKVLFKNINVNLITLSDLIDELKSLGINTADELIEEICFRLSKYWGIPNVTESSKIPKIKNMKKGTVKSAEILEKAYKFITRMQFSKGITNSQFNTYTLKIDQYADDNEIDIDESFPLEAPVFNSYTEFKESLLDFISGKNNKELKEKFLQLDFSVVDKVLNIKLPKEPKLPTEKDLKIFGEPIEIYTEMILKSVYEFRKDYKELPEEILIKLNSIKITNCNDDDEKVVLLNRIRLRLAGIVEYLNVIDNLEIKYIDELDPFSANYTEDLNVTKTNNINELSKIQYTIYAKCDGDEKVRKREYTYCFSNLDAWFNDFILLEQDLLTNEINDYSLPLYEECTNISQYVNCEVEEEFFIKLQKIKLNRFNIEVIQDLSKIDENDINGEFALLREEYKTFIREFNELGFYNTIGEASSCKKVFNRYSYLLKLIKEKYNGLTSTQKTYVKTMLNIFLIGDKKYSDFKNMKCSIVMMAPSHPIMLEKFFYKQEHIRNSIKEIVEQLSLGDINKEDALDKRLDYIFKMSAINSGFDIYAFNEQEQLKSGEIYGRYAIYHLMDNEFNILTDNGVRNDILELEEVDNRSIKKKTHKSEIIFHNIKDYVNTFPARADGVNLLFINPDEMQHIVSGINTAIDYYSELEKSLNINVRILVSNDRRSGEDYLKHWLNSHEQSENNSKVRTFINYIDVESNKLFEQIKRYLGNQDLTFIYNILENVSVDFSLCADKYDFSEIKYPAIVTPMPVSISQELRAIDISQRQFQSSSEHLQLTHKILRPNEVDGVYRAIKKKEIKDAQKEVIQQIHNESKWVVCLDETIDKNILNSQESKVIGFSTGKGLFGELNTTVSARLDVLEDLQHKLKMKLMSKFSKWMPEIADKAANNCIEISKNLDGSQMLKALNPNSTEIHNFLAYVMTMQAIQVKEREERFVIKTLINLDNYLHWFDDYLVNDYTNKNNLRPDFMVLEINKDEDLFDVNKPLKIKATVIECKMSKETSAYIDEAIEQVKEGIDKLANKFSQYNSSINRRYWYNQLYRSLIFSKINMKDNEAGYETLINKLSGIFEGKFEIEWHGRVYAYWLDVNNSELNKLELDKVSESNYEINTFEVYTAGQLFIQKLLLPKEIREEVEIEFSVEDSKQDTDFEINVLGIKHEGDEIIEITEEELSIPKKKETITINDENLDCKNSNGEKELDINNIEIKEVNNEISEGEEENNEEKISSKKTDDEISSLETDTSIITEELDKGEEVEEITEKPLEVNQNARFLLGEDQRTKEKIYWEYMNKQLNNRHLLINGNSGSGKTYCIQTLILEAAKNNISVIVFDYTDGFTQSKLSPVLLNKLGDKFEERYVKFEKFPINPFKRRLVKFNGREFTEPDVDVANRIASSFKNVYKFGPQQRNTIYSSVIEGIKEHGDAMTLERLAEKLSENGDSTAGTSLSKIRPLVDYNPFEASSDFSWNNIVNKKGGMYVIQLSGFDREIQLILTDLILWDIWNYAVANGNEATPMPIVLDEAQNLSHGEDTPSGKILAEGRKFGISGWYATQFMKGRLTPGEIGNLQQAAQKLYFSPPEESIVEVSKYIDITNDGSKAWAEKLSKLIKGQCVTAGYKANNGKFDKYQPKIIKITSLEDRINE